MRLKSSPLRGPRILMSRDWWTHSHFIFSIFSKSDLQILLFSDTQSFGRPRSSQSYKAPTELGELKNQEKKGSHLVLKWILPLLGPLPLPPTLFPKSTTACLSSCPKAQLHFLHIFITYSLGTSKTVENYSSCWIFFLWEYWRFWEKIKEVLTEQSRMTFELNTILKTMECIGFAPEVIDNVFISSIPVYIIGDCSIKMCLNSAFAHFPFLSTVLPFVSYIRS